MAMTWNLRKSFISSLLLTAVCWPGISIAADSSSISNNATSTTSPTTLPLITNSGSATGSAGTVSGTPFLLDAGYTNPANTASTAANTSALTATTPAFVTNNAYTTAANSPTLAANNSIPGLQYIVGCWADSSTTGLTTNWVPANLTGTNKGVPICIVQTVTGKGKTCPVGFMPYVTLDLIGTQNNPVTSNFACLSNTKVNQSDAAIRTMGSGNTASYLLTIATTGNTGSTSRPLSGISWKVYCFPNTRDSTTLATKSTAPPPEPCNLPDRNFNQEILLWDMGRVGYGTGASSTNSTDSSVGGAQNSYTVNTHRICPPGYQPYARISSNTTIGQGALRDVSTDARVTDSMDLIGPSGICVQAISSSAGASYYTIRFRDQVNRARLTWSSTGVTINPVVSDRHLNIKWELYCFPPGLPPSRYPTNALGNNSSGFRTSGTDSSYQNQDTGGEYWCNTGNGMRDVPFD